MKTIKYQGKYSIQATNIDGFSYVKHFPNHWELSHYCSRLSLTNLIEVFIITPDVKYILVYSTLKGVNKMQDFVKDPFEQFAEENPPQFTPYLDGKNTDKNGNDHPGPGKAFLAQGPNYVPFRITSAWVKESQLYDDQVNYMIEFDTEHENFKRAYDFANIESAYILTQTATEQRKKQLQMLSDNGYVGKTGKWVILQKFGRAYDFRDAQVQGLY